MREVAKENPHLTWLPKAIANVDPRPRPELWHAHYWDAWHALRWDRVYIGQMAVETPISYIAIDRYAERNGIEGEAFELLLRFVSTIDSAYLDQREADRKAALAAATPPQPEATHG